MQSKNKFTYSNFFIVVASLTVLAEESSVYDAIVKNYNKNVRSGDNMATLVSVKLNYFILLSLDQKEQTINFVADLQMNWKDERLKWNSSAFGGTTYILVPSSLLWRPEIIFTSGLSVDYIAPEEQRLVRILSDGTVTASSFCVVINQCVLSIEAFPFDEQNCNVTFGPWMSNNSLIDLKIGEKSTKGDTYESYEGNGEWKLLSMKPTLRHFIASDGGNWSDVNYTVRIKRQPIYYVCVLLIPAFLTTTICLIGMFFPSHNTGEREEKVSMGLTTLLAIAVMLGTVANEMPKTTTLPLLGFYVLAELIICIIGIVISMLIMFAHQRAFTRVLLPPRWINTIILFKNKAGTIAKPEKANNAVFKSLSDHEMIYQPKSFMNSISMKRFNQILDRLENYIDNKEYEEQILLQWIIIFDRIDIFFLILLNLVNVVVSGILLF